MKPTALLLVLAVALTLHAGQKVREDLSWFYEALRQADAVEVLEGLPHRSRESDVFNQERQRQNPFVLAGEFFYEKRPSVTGELGAELTEGFLSKRLFETPVLGEPVLKACGGFHADFGIRWLKDKEPLVSALICFGCSDIKLIGLTEKITCSMTKSGSEILKARLTPLRTSRPKPSKRQKIEMPELEKLSPGKPKIDLKSWSRGVLVGALALKRPETREGR